MKRSFSIILFISVFIMNAGILCESLCLKDSHMSHDMMSHTKHESSKTQPCPISKTHHNHSSNAESKAFIKCGCSSDYELSLNDVPLLLETTSDLIPQVYFISLLSPHISSFINAESIPLEKPPKILS